jgi:hypothetical protein
MIFMRANTYRGLLEGVGPENLDFSGPEMAMGEESAIWAHKGRDFQGSEFEFWGTFSLLVMFKY